MIDMSEEDKPNWLVCGDLSINNVNMVIQGMNIKQFSEIYFWNLALRHRYESESTIILSPNDIAILAQNSIDDDKFDFSTLSYDKSMKYETIACVLFSNRFDHLN